MQSARFLVALSSVALVLGCEARSFEVPIPHKGKMTEKPYNQTLEKEVDLLFVIDKSLSMLEEQENLRRNFGKMIDALKHRDLDGRIPNVRIGVITTDLGAGNYGAAVPGCETPGGDGGKLQHRAGVPGCPTPSDPWISYEEGVINVAGCQSGDPIECVKESFSCIANVGVEGCGFEMQLESARRALDPQLNVNPGFLRDEAFLALIFITDEDDCSAARPELFDPTSQGLGDPLGPLTSFRCFEFGIECDINDRSVSGPRQNCRPAYDWLHKVEKYTRFFADLKGDKDRVIVAAITGPKGPVSVGKDGTVPALMPSCQTGDGFAVPAIRITQFVESLEGTVHKICTDDFGPALKQIGDKIIATIGGQCISGPLLVPNGGVACRAGVDACKMPSCPAGESCDAARGVCLDASGDATQNLCGESCLDKADCILSLQARRSDVETPLERCPRELFDPSIPKEQCGSHCPCWRIVPRGAQCTDSGSSPFGFEVMRSDEPARGTKAIARCFGALYDWSDDEVQKAPFHCAAP